MKEIPLTQGKVALVDDEDYERVMQFKWCASEQGRTHYGVRKVRGSKEKKRQYLHNFILGRRGVDHKNGEGLDNRRENLRPATQLQNLRGFKRKRLGASSQYRGVSLDKNRQLWRASIGVDGRLVHLGYLSSEADAARAYDAKARELFGEFASPNFNP